MLGLARVFVLTAALTALVVPVAPASAAVAPAAPPARATPVRSQDYATLDAAGLGLPPSGARATTLLRLRGDQVCFTVTWAGLAEVTSARVRLRGADGQPGNTVLTLFSGPARSGHKADGCARPVPTPTMVALADQASSYVVVVGTASAPAGAVSGALKPQSTSRELRGQVGRANVVVAADGTQWSPEGSRTGTKLVRIDPQGGTTVVDLSRPDDPVDLATEGLALAPDGAIWVSATTFGNIDGSPDVGRITRLDPSGTSRAYRMPAGLGPMALAIGSDGAIWFGAFKGDTSHWGVGRLATNGSVTFQPTAGESYFPVGMATGSDGNVYYISAFGPHLRITPDGVITKLAGGNGNGGGVLGPDGAVWFTDSEQGIGRIATDGTITYRPVNVGFEYRNPTALFLDPDGTIWFTASVSGAHDGYIGRMSPDGKIAKFFLRGVRFPYGLAPAPGGLIRFYSPFESTLGEIVRPLPFAKIG